VGSDPRRRSPARRSDRRPTRGPAASVNGYGRVNWERLPALPSYPHGQVVTRAQWGAARPRGRFVARGPLRAVVLHHTSRPSAHLIERGVEAEAAYMREIQNHHLARGWIDVGYHLVIMPSGRVFLGRPTSALGAHVAGHNRGTVGVSLAGDFDEEEPTPEAICSIEGVLEWFAPGGASVHVVGHRDLVATTTCPGDLLHPYVPRERRRALVERSAAGRIHGGVAMP
jgi:hypothetical protein